MNGDISDANSKAKCMPAKVAPREIALGPGPDGGASYQLDMLRLRGALPLEGPHPLDSAENGAKGQLGGLGNQCPRS